MTKILPLVLAVVGLSSIGARAQSVKTALDDAAAALGAANLTSIEFSGTGSDYIFGQAYDGNSPWPRFGLPRFTMAIDYRVPAMRDDRVRVQVQNPPLGGGFQPLVGELRQSWLFSGGYAWDVVGGNAVPAAPERDLRSAAVGRLAQIWLTPHGFIKAAASGNASAKTETIRGAKKTIITFTAPNKTRFEGVLNEQNLVEQIATRFDNPVLGDTVFEAVFGDYKDFGGVKFPTHILQRSGGYPVLDLAITNVKPNVALSIEVPPHIRQAQPPSQAIKTEVLSDGVWNLWLDARDRTVVVEFQDYVAVVEAHDGEAVSIAAIDAVKKLVPAKPIRYIINTHSHFDHAGGLRTYVAEGARVITHRDNIPFYEQVWANPRTINPDRLAKSGRQPVFEGVVGSRTLTDGSRELVLYHYAGNMHNSGMLMVYLPKERILIEADSYSPSDNPNDVPTAIPNLVHFHDAVDRLKLEVDVIVPMHGRLATLDEVRKVTGTYRDTQLWAR
ncbi:MAG TPA: MBL fold metallo-hydrolase [Vicinamibacterales bacterium]|jgi:glyoxylase-like metal-dependent hydrolase (beta-lactamase superfamily II)